MQTPYFLIDSEKIEKNLFISNEEIKYAIKQLGISAK